MPKCAVFILLLMFFFNLEAQAFENNLKKTSIKREVESMPVIVAFGDSLTAGYSVRVDKGYPALIEKKLHKAGYSHKVVNAGISGDTTSGGVRRVGLVIRENPEIVILELGVNDALRGTSLKVIANNLEQIVQQLQKEGIIVILAGMRIPPNYGKVYSNGFKEIFVTLSKKYSLSFIPFLLEGVAGKSELNQYDGIHPTEKGYEVVAETVWSVLKSVVKKN